MLLRRISQHIRNQNWFAVVLDFVIVVAGVLIAFQITNWDQNRRENVAAQSYVTSISKNIEFDLDRLAALKEKRIKSLNFAQGLNWTQLRISYIDLATVRTASEAFRSVSDYEYFNADTSGFEGLKSSGLLSKIQGNDIESLIFAYYNLAEAISLYESDYNEFLKEAFRAFSSETFENLQFLYYPEYIAGDAELTNLQGSFREILLHPSVAAIFRYVYEDTPELIIMYDNLEILGREIVAVAANRDRRATRSSRDVLNQLFDMNGDQAYPFVLLNGVPVDRFYELGLAAANGDLPDVTYGFDQINVEFPKVEWAVYYYRNRSSPFSEKPVKDFSGYEAVRLTLKGAVGNENLLLSMKDSTDPDDGSESRVALKLDTSWTTYEVPLSAFETANLEDIFAPMQFIFEDTSAKISIKEIEFLRAFESQTDEAP